MKTRVALAQFPSTSDVEENLDKIADMTRTAARSGAHIVCFPELATTIYFAFERNERYYEWAEPIPGPSTDRIAEVARETGTAVILPMIEKDGEKRYNSAAFIGPDGQLIGRYRKNVIPKVPHVLNPGETPGDEKFYFEAGDGYPVFDTPFGLKVGILICFDRHFPEAPRVLALGGADIIFVPTASYRAFYKEAWEVGLRAHAQMNLFYVAGVNKVGQEKGGPIGRHYFGRSVLAAPDGQVLARASDEHEDIIYGDVDPEVVAEQREIWGFFRERRPELYGALVEVKE